MTKGDTTTSSNADEAGVPTYPWSAAPAHLKTRRQLRAAGLRPNGQDIAAFMVRKRRRGRKPLVAHLFDLAKAAPKRTASPAQLDAIRKATTEHQARAAERHGIDRGELHREVDPGPGWADPTPTLQGGKTMSDNLIPDQAAELAAIGGEVAELRAAGQIDAGLADYVTSVTSEATEERPRLGVPAGHGQKMAYLLASVALRRADEQAYELDQAAADAAMGNTDAQTDIDSARAMAQAQLTRFSWDSGRESAMEVLAAAIVWGSDPQLAEVAARRVDELTSHYHGTWGVVIDVEEGTVGIDPDFDAETWQRYTEASVVYDRQAAAVDVLSARALEGRVMDAVMAWHGEPPMPGTAGMYLATEKTRRAQLSAALADAGASNTVRSGVEFVVDYLRGDVSGTDLTNTPVLVDPAHEVRGRVGELLERFADRGDSFARIMAREVEVMTPEDQLRVREIGFAIRDSRQDAEMEPWPDWIDRDDLADRIRDFARDARDVAAYANDAATADGLRLDDDVQEMLADMGRDRAVIGALLTKEGLHPAEKAALTALVADIDLGRVDDRNLPELLLLDERTKREIDLRRHGHAAHEIAARTADSVKQLIGAGVDMSLHTDPGWTLEAVRNDIDALARGGLTPAQLSEHRQDFDTDMNHLGRALRGAGVDTPTRVKIRAAVDQGVHAAGKHGKTRAGREQHWHERLHSATAAVQRQGNPETRALPSTSRTNVDREQAAAMRLTALAQAHPCGASTEPAQASGGRRITHGAGVELVSKREREGRA
ncbi:RRQRL motif-containing zinc-binding protein [Nocardia gipuzkoensis]|uniref:RRQRL motif-containing zinc-binding protein n=1 Tax=Nocardia gipuzkoensis TaxID=2749991 RepID=UPI0015EF48C8|nr:RRQRL motif-containing zinc-binding protein [Nocardia gipuzkoensis]